jgi:hypothetical protein
MEMVFSGSSKEDANRKANELWEKQNGLRAIERTEVAISDEGRPSLLDANRWAVTIHYVDES